MARGKYLSLEEARKGETPGATLEQFAKEHPSQADGPMFSRLLDAMARGKPASAGTSAPAVSEGYSGTQTHQGTSEGDEG